jgi:hypothetical protein
MGKVSVGESPGLGGVSVKFVSGAVPKGPARLLLLPRTSVRGYPLPLLRGCRKFSQPLPAESADNQAGGVKPC